jgi:hypothetical protein
MIHLEKGKNYHSNRKRHAANLRRNQTANEADGPHELASYFRSPPLRKDNESVTLSDLLVWFPHLFCVNYYTANQQKICNRSLSSIV